MTQPPDDRRPMPWEPPDDAAPTDPPGPPEQASPPEPAPPPASATPPSEPPAPDAPTTAWTQPTPPTPPATPTGSSWSPPPPASQAGPSWGQPPVSDATPPAAAGGPILSASPSEPTVGWAMPAAAPAEVAPGLAYASTASRFIAYLIDLIIIGIIGSIIAGIVAGPSFTTIDTGSGNFGGYQTSMMSPVYSIVTVALGAAYFILSWSGGRRATLGQRALHIQVGNAVDGRSLTTEQAVRRWLGLGAFLAVFNVISSIAPVASLIELLWIIVLLITTVTSPTKQGLHDRFAGSAVVRPIGASNTAVMACLVIALIVLLLAVVSIVALIFVGGQVSSILSEVGESV
jgi:uncharacterized RDD family membrane protein YckC